MNQNRSHANRPTRLTVADRSRKHAPQRKAFTVGDLLRLVGICA
jgi:hypothetical protein